ncbi:MAG: hypothetical protein ABIH23_10495 [bacterium]
MHIRTSLALLVFCLTLGLCVGCANVGKKLGKVGKVFTPVTSAVKGTTGLVKKAGSGMADDTRHYTTKIPGAKETTLSPSQQRAIAQYERKKRYEQYKRKYNLDSRIIPKGASVSVDK